MLLLVVIAYGSALVRGDLAGIYRGTVTMSGGLSILLFGGGLIAASLSVWRKKLGAAELAVGLAMIGAGVCVPAIGAPLPGVVAIGADCTAPKVPDGWEYAPIELPSTRFGPDGRQAVFNDRGKMSYELSEDGKGWVQIDPNARMEFDGGKYYQLGAGGKYYEISDDCKSWVPFDVQ
ncbi:hypothetical protein [Methylocella sp.]|jgi:hypothetical protein|uniref:hypothetical protein n=1 Tax=Methylocella sp. TaxID=1978226 RepID=UPI003C249ACF